jgi:hypothetical protein
MLATALDSEKMEKIEHDRIMVTNLCNNIRNGVLACIPHVPDTWDGHEYRQLLADLFAAEVFKHTMRGKRLKDYRNERAVNPRIP